MLILLAPAVAEWSTWSVAPVQKTAETIVVAVAVLVRRRSPIASLVLASSVNLLFVLGEPNPWSVFAAVVLSFLAGRRTNQIWRPQAAFAAVAGAGLLLAVVVGDVSGWVTVLLMEFFTAALPWWAGSWWRQRTELARAGWQRAEQLERERRIVAEQARLRERTRIAQDMHDSLGHELGLISLLAGGLELAREVPEAHRATAAQLRAGAVSATRRLHEVIGLLRLDAEPATIEPADTDIAGLVQRARDSGVPVVLERSARPDTSTEPYVTTQRAAYRVVQEALTNATKHAPGAETIVRIDHLATETIVSVTNAPPPHGGPTSPAGSGVGLIGLAERVRVAGGTLRAGPRDGGFEVLARLPHAPSPIPAAAAENDLVHGALTQAKQQLHGNLVRSAALPAALALGTAGMLLATYAFTVATTSLHPDEFAALQVGQTRAEVAPHLPGYHIASPPPVLTQPPIPAGARCEYYRVSRSLVDLSQDMYRLCFADDVLVAKDTLRQQTESSQPTGKRP